MKDKVDFLSADKHQRFLQIGARCVWSDMPKLPKFSQFAISLQYLMKKVNNEVDFFATDKHESSLEIDTMIFEEDGQAFPKFPKYQASFWCLYCLL